MRTVTQQLASCSVKINFDSGVIDRNMFGDAFIKALSHKKSIFLPVGMLMMNKDD